MIWLYTLLLRWFRTFGAIQCPQYILACNLAKIKNDIPLSCVVLADNLPLKQVIINWHNFGISSILSKCPSNIWICAVPWEVVGFSLHYMFTICMIYSLNTIQWRLIYYMYALKYLQFSNYHCLIRYLLIKQPTIYLVQHKCQYCCGVYYMKSLHFV